MTTNHIKAILTSLRAMVIKMLPAYKFYLGSTTETTTTQICHGVMSVKDGQTFGNGALTLDDASFTGFVDGETYTVAVNGVSGEYVAKLFQDTVVGVTNAADLENPPENYWAAAFAQGTSVYMVAGSYANATISVSQTKTATTKKYKTKKLDNSLLPDSVGSGIEAANTKAATALSAAQAAQDTANEAISGANTAQSTANTAQTTADAAKTTANTAQTTANTAKSTADAAAPKENPVFTGTFSQNRMSNTTVGDYSHAEGLYTTASGYCSHAEGTETTASGYCSHAEGCDTTASGYYSHAEGGDTTASGSYSHAEGTNTIATSSEQHVQGKFNIEDTAGKYAHIVGNGEYTAYRSNAHTLDWDGVPWYKGRPQFGGTAQDNGAQTVVGNGDKEIILASSTSGSTKKFKLTVDDTGTLKATEVTDA